MNNLRQWSLGAHNFESARSHFPTLGVGNYWNHDTDLVQFSRVGAGSTGDPTAGSPSSVETANWLFQLLPFVEQQATFDLRSDFGISKILTPNDTFVSEVQLPILSCPSRGERTVEVLGKVFATTDYGAANVYTNWVPTGISAYSGDAPEARDDEASWRGMVIPGAPFQGNQINDKFSKIGFEAVPDGSSNTIFALEKSVDGSQLNAVTNDHNNVLGDAGGPYNPGLHASSYRFARGGNGSSFFADNEQRDDRSPRLYFEQGFGSAHSGVVIAGMGDGSVHAIGFETSADIVGALVVRNDGQPIDSSAF